MDPSDPAWVDHILDQLTSRPMPAGPDVASAAAEEAEALDATPQPADDDTDSHDPLSAGQATPRPAPPTARPNEPAALAPEVGLLDDLLSLDLEPAEDPVPDPAGPATRPAPPDQPLAEVPPRLPAASGSEESTSRVPRPAVPEVPLAPPPPPVTEPPPMPLAMPPPIPAPPRRPVPLSAPRTRPRLEDPLLAGPPPSPTQAPPTPPQRRAAVRAEPRPEAPYDDEDDYYSPDFDEHLEESHSRWRTVLGWALTVAIAIVLSLVIRSFVAHAFHVESSSMQPTLAPGDRILVNKLAGNPSRGDLVVFSRPDGDLVKRVVALEGETVYFFDDGVIGIDDQYLQEPYLSVGTGSFVRGAIPNCDSSETLAGAVACRVPEDHIFVLGDNREVSYDSRNFGPVPRADLVGNAAVQFWPLGDLRSL